MFHNILCKLHLNRFFLFLLLQGPSGINGFKGEKVSGEMSHGAMIICTGQKSASESNLLNNFTILFFKLKSRVWRKTQGNKPK